MAETKPAWAAAVDAKKEAAKPALRTDGPTMAEYVKAGYDAKNYPPAGYSDRRGNITIINGRQGEIILKDGRHVPSGQAAEVSAAEGAELLNHFRITDASKIAGPLSGELERLKEELAASRLENARLLKLAPKGSDKPAPAAPGALKAEDAVQHKDGRKGTLDMIDGAHALVDFGDGKPAEVLTADLKAAA